MLFPPWFSLNHISAWIIHIGRFIFISQIRSLCKKAYASCLRAFVYRKNRRELYPCIQVPRMTDHQNTDALSCMFSSSDYQMLCRFGPQGNTWKSVPVNAKKKDWEWKGKIDLKSHMNFDFFFECQSTLLDASAFFAVYCLLIFKSMIPRNKILLKDERLWKCILSFCNFLFIIILIFELCTKLKKTQTIASPTKAICLKLSKFD